MKFINLTGKKFEKLIVISQAETNKNKKTRWNCICDCGNETIVCGNSLQTNHTTSCGKCINPILSSIYKIWHGTYKELSINNFYKLSQLPCHYCNLINSNVYFRNDKKEDIEKAIFNYNGIDRIDSNLSHTILNCVPSCKYCNMSKLNYSYDNFLNWILKINKNISNIIFPINYKIESIILDKYKFYSSKVVWDRYRELSFNEFLYLSQQNCFYCNIPPYRVYNKYKNLKSNHKYIKSKNKLNIAKLEGNFTYNGLDRIDSNLTHTLDNVVPCCSQCNYAKHVRSLDEFKDWIIRVHDNIIKKDLLNIDVNIFIKQYMEIECPLPK